MRCSRSKGQALDRVVAQHPFYDRDSLVYGWGAL